MPEPRDQGRDQEEAPPVTIQVTFGMRRRLSLLAGTGIYGRTVEEVAERMVARQLEEMGEAAHER
jgi:hypothetical protein